jgi:hypothetical protein
LLHHTRPQPSATPPPEIAINCIPVVEIYDYPQKLDHILKWI